MRRYAPEDEERIRVQAQVRAWATAGLLGADQAAVLDARLRTTLRRTNVFLRAILALFTAFIVAAFVTLVAISLGITSAAAAAVLLSIAAVSCLALAEFAVGTYEVYRYGVEEALAAAAAVLAAVAGNRAAHALALPNDTVVAMVVGALSSLGVYLRFGFVYAAIAAMLLAAVAPFDLEMAEAARHVAAAAICASIFLWTRRRRRRIAEDTVQADDDALIHAAAYAGVYAAVNLHLFDAGGESSSAVDAWFSWLTYVATWLLPLIGLTLALRDKDRPLLLVALASALATLYTNKLYLGWPRQTWDPILLGVLLVAVATVVRRWLDSGPDGARHGFTAREILAGDRAALDAMVTASALWPQQPQHAPTTTSPSSFEGGRSGGAGGGATY